MSKNLVIVESPAKAKTISKFLGKDYQVEASIGHIRDLPANSQEIPEKYKKEKWARLGVDVKHDFEPLYVVPEAKKKQVKKLKQAIKGADNLYLATDEDREGESISWHLLEILKPKQKPKRLVFHEITKEAIADALKNPRDIDLDLVEAQETRRILDRLYGYEISPVLWRKVAPRLSAGRVQSVAIKLVVERERKRMKFVPAEYYGLVGQFSKAKDLFNAELKKIGQKTIAHGKDFDPETGKLKSKDKIVLSEQEATELVKKLQHADFKVENLEEKPYKKYPQAPFITSTLQQEAARKLRFSAKRTMQIAQKLYEHGYITYMRTDSTNLAVSAVKEAQKLIEKLYGKNYLATSGRKYQSKVKNAQEAHEAIRPAGKTFRLPEDLARELDKDEATIYELIWKRTIASQMKEADLISTVAEIADKDKHIFHAHGKQIKFPGFLKAYVQGSDDPDEELEDQEKILPSLKIGDKVDLKKLNAEFHQTKPIPRFTEASLIKDLEARGIGRPSTYATIMDTIQRREYVYKNGNTLIPTFVAFAVVDLMTEFFTHLVDYEFTAEMEEDLDEISHGSKKSKPYLKQFYFGDKKHQGLQDLIAQDIDARKICTIPISKKVTLRIGKFGPFLEQGEKRAPLPDGIAPADLDEATALDLLENNKSSGDNVGKHPDTKLEIVKKVGRYGPYLQMGEKGDADFKMKSIPKFVSPEELTLEQAVKILSLPVSLGKSKEYAEIKMDIGPYGPYLKSGKGNTPISNGYDVLNLTLKQAEQIIATKPDKNAKGKGAASANAVKDFGGGLVIKVGRYGPYVTNGKVNAALPKGANIDKLTSEEAAQIIAKKKMT